ncbi:MAG: hypothetical protein LUC30_01245 [Clostridiales bacterium]|nr:hypothetical protein [Clostridiales bacterium]
MPDMSEGQLNRVNRAARDPVTGKSVTVPGDMTYREWYEKYVKGKNGVANSGESGIINQTSKRDGVQDVRQVCRLDPELYHCVTSDIATDEVVITEKQIEHIKERHPDDYEICEKWAGTIIRDPDYIIKSEKPSTAIVLRQIEENGKKYRLVLRLKTSKDPEDYKNSIITFQKVKEKEWKRLLRNKEILYKRE